MSSNSKWTLSNAARFSIANYIACLRNKKDIIKAII